jgi:hypothetical protein
MVKKFVQFDNSPVQNYRQIPTAGINKVGEDVPEIAMFHHDPYLVIDHIIFDATPNWKKTCN